MSQVQVVSNTQAWNSSALGCGPVEPVVSRVSSSSSSTAGGVSKLRHRSRVQENNNSSSNKEKEVQPTTDERALRDESKAARRLLQKKQDAIMTLAQERFGNEAQAKQEVLHAYAKLAVKWFQKTAEGQTFDAKKVEKQIQQTLEVFSNFLKEWHMDYLLLPALIYVERYFRVLGSISHQYVFDLFLTGVVLSIKFWHDPVIANTTFSKIFDIPTNVLTFNELNFLYAVDYNLVLDQEHVQVFTRRLVF
jgi:hypothetical protein